MSQPRLADITGRLRSPAATPGHRAGCAPPTKGLRSPADPPTVEEIILVMRQAGPGRYADRTRALIAILWRAGLRISEALALTETDLDPNTGSGLVRSGNGAKRRMTGMEDWAWEHLTRWTEHRIQLPVGPLFCILAGLTRGRAWSATAARGELRRLAAQAGVRRRFAAHQLRHAHTIEMAHDGIPLPIIQRQLGHYAGDPVSDHDDALRPHPGRDPRARVPALSQDHRRRPPAGRRPARPVRHARARQARRPDPPERVLPAAAPPELRPRQRVPDLRQVRHRSHPPRRAPASAVRLLQIVDARREQFQQKTGREMPEDNVWLRERRRERSALESIIAALDATARTDQAVRGAGVQARLQEGVA